MVNAFHRVPPHLVLPDFLPPEKVPELVNYMCAHQAEFRDGRTYTTGVNKEKRISLELLKLGPYRTLFQERILALEEEIFSRLGVPRILLRFEMRFVASGDGAFFKPHVDTNVGIDLEEPRTVNIVYYFHRRPTAFEGGALRLHALDMQSRVDIPPDWNSAVAFPAWAIHEVMPVRSPSGDFGTGRFAMVCCLRRRMT